MNLVTEISKLTNVPVYVRWILGLVLLLALSFWEFVISAVKVWMDSETFNHCFLVLPISVYLIWRQRAEIALRSPEFSPLFFILLLLCLPLWMLAYAGSINLLGHLTSFFMIAVLIGSVIGRDIAFKLWFPLLFLMFSVPVGEELIPLFQRITADLSVRLLLLSNVPVFYEGLFISIPEGKFLVAEACSGVRFFVSTVMLGTLYAYLLFNGWRKRSAFILFSIALPIIANVLRVYGTIMIGHYVSMDKAAGTDHLIYGWFFFALVMIFLVLVGNYFSDSTIGKRSENGETIVDAGWKIRPSNVVLSLYGAFFAIFFSWKFLIDAGLRTPNELALEGLSEQFVEQFSAREWQPKFVSYSSHNSYLDMRSNFPLELDIIQYHGTDPEAELIYWNNRVYDPERWTLSSANHKTAIIGDAKVSYTVLNVVSNRGIPRSILYWYQIGGFYSSSAIRVKLLGAYNRMTGSGGGGSFIAISTIGGSELDRENKLDSWMKHNFLELLKLEH